MELTLDQIHTYLQCPALYDFKYGMNLEGEESDTIAYSKSLHKTVSYFYFTLMSGMIPTAKQMKDKWASIWNEHKNGLADITESLLKERQYKRDRPKMDKQIVQGMEAIHNFYHFNKDNPGTPIAVDHEYRVPIAGVTIKGKFELIRESIDKSTSNRFIEIVDFKTGNEATDAFLINHDLNLTMMSYAFRNLFQSEEDRLVLSYLKSGKEIYVSRSDKEFDRMKAVVEGVAEGLTNKRFYPRQTFMCKSCPFKNVCDVARFQ
jgi:CRISPR/Cas system-associated exonuclease Cas4 (RecB family)